MDVISVPVHIRPSGGEGRDSGEISAELMLYCRALQRAMPTHTLQIGNANVDVVQLHTTALLKAAQTDESAFGLTVAWEPFEDRPYHTVDPTDPTVWSDDPNGSSILYEVTMDSGDKKFLCITTRS